MRLNRVALVLLLFPLACAVAAAQGPGGVEEEMNRIKLDMKYVFGEGSSDSKDDAYGIALADFVSVANEYRGNEGKAPIAAGSIQPMLRELVCTGDSRIQILLYMEYDKMMQLKGQDDGPKYTVGQPAQQQPAQPQPQAQPAPQPQPQQAQPQPEQKTLTFVPNQTAAGTGLSKDMTLALCAQDNWMEVKGFLTDYKRGGFISATGAVTSASQVPDDAYAILIDGMGGILSILTPRNSGNRIDLRTNQSDNETNHSDCKFIVWYK